MSSGFVTSNRCSAAVGVVDYAGGPAGRGKGCRRNLWTFLQFCCEPKTAPENKVYSLKFLTSHSFFIVNLQTLTCALHSRTVSWISRLSGHLMPAALPWGFQLPPAQLCRGRARGASYLRRGARPGGARGEGRVSGPPPGTALYLRVPASPYWK